jgi:hypothetical protein
MNSYERRKKVTITLYVEPEQKKVLDKLSKETGVPASEYLRAGLDAVLKDSQNVLKQYIARKK